MQFHSCICSIIVYYKSLSDSHWCQNYYNWAFFYSNQILSEGWGGTKLLFWITNMTNYYLFYVIIAIWEWIVQYFSSYLHDKHCIFASILLITYQRILYINKLTWKYNVFMSMTWKGNFYSKKTFSLFLPFRVQTSKWNISLKL